MEILLAPWNDTNRYSQEVNKDTARWPMVGNYTSITTYVEDYGKALARDKAWRREYGPV